MMLAKHFAVLLKACLTLWTFESFPDITSLLHFLLLQSHILSQCKAVQGCGNFTFLEGLALKTHQKRLLNLEEILRLPFKLSYFPSAWSVYGYFLCFMLPSPR